MGDSRKVEAITHDVSKETGGVGNVILTVQQADHHTAGNGVGNSR